MKVTIKKDQCAGCNMCGAVSNGVISVGGTGKACVNTEANLSDPAIIEAVKMTAQVCPQQAIVISEENA